VRRNLYTFIFATAAAVSTAAFSQSMATGQLDQGGRPFDVMAIDVASIRLNMTPEQAELAVKAKGYAVDHWVTGPNFSQEVQDAVHARDPRRPAVSYSVQTTKRQLWLKGSSGETMHVFFMPMPEGPRASEVVVDVDVRRTSQSIFEKQIVAKYGLPTKWQQENITNYWCGFAGRDCGAEWASGRYAYLRYTAFPNPQIALTNANDMAALIAQFVTAEVDRLAPKAGAAF
jgi:hypothetical protein